MNFSTFNNRIKIIFCISSVFMILSLAMFISYLVSNTTRPLHVTYLVLFLWFGGTSTLLFNYLLFRNLPFFQKIDLTLVSNYTITFVLLVYIIFFPLIGFLTLFFLLVFVLILLVLALITFFNWVFKRKKEHH